MGWSKVKKINKKNNKNFKQTIYIDLVNHVYKKEVNRFLINLAKKEHIKIITYQMMGTKFDWSFFLFIVNTLKMCGPHKTSFGIIAIEKRSKCMVGYWKQKNYVYITHELKSLKPNIKLDRILFDTGLVWYRVSISNTR